MNQWLLDGILTAAQDPPEEFLGYCYGRGLKRAMLEEMRVGVWSPPSSPAPDETYAKQHGAYGQYRKGWMTIPYWSPSGSLLGVEYRSWGDMEKGVRDYRLPKAKFNPVFMGLTPSSVNKLWKGGDVWLVEGVFDMALSHAIPKKDAIFACGTARVVRQQFQFIERFLDPSATVHLVFDEDETGRKQVTGYYDADTGKKVLGVPERFRRRDINCRAVRYSGGKDPGEIWEKGGTAALRRVFYL